MKTRMGLSKLTILRKIVIFTTITILLTGCSMYGYHQEGDQVYYYNELDYPSKSNFLADLESFKIINDLYAKDKDYIFYKGKKIYGADVTSFELFKDGYGNLRFGKDNFSVYYEGKKIEDADPKTIQSVGQNNNLYLKDKKAVYIYGYKIIDADPQSFEVLDCAFSRDKNAVYKYQEKISFDPSSFQVSNSDCNKVKDKNGEYIL